MSSMALIELVSDDDHIVVHSDDKGDIEGIWLGTDPDGLYSTTFKTRTVSGAFEVGGRSAGHEIPVRELTLPFELVDDGDGIDQVVSRFNKMWRMGREIQFRYTSDLSGTRVLWVQLAEQVEYTTGDGYDRGLSDYVHAVVSAVALQPMYESAERSVSWSNPSSGSHIGSVVVSNPTDQYLWLEWSMDPATQWVFPDFSFGNEAYWDRPANADSDRMIVSPSLNARLSVMADPQYDTYVSEDGSNVSGLFNGVEPMYWVPPYTPNIELPVACNGPVDATITCTMRRFWSAESGLH